MDWILSYVLVDLLSRAVPVTLRLDSEVNR